MNHDNMIRYVPQKSKRTVVITVATIIGINIAILCFAWYMIPPVMSQPAGVIVHPGAIEIAETATPGPRPTPQGNIRAYKVGSIITWQRTVSRIETKEYDVVGDLVQAREGGVFGIGSESIQAHLVGTVIGRTDLARLLVQPDMQSGDITISPDGESISIVLPYPEITRPLLDEAQSSFDNHQIGWFTASDPRLWQEAHTAAALMLIQKACEQGIGEQTRQETESQIRSIFSLGFKHVFVQTRPATMRCGG